MPNKFSKTDSDSGVGRWFLIKLIKLNNENCFLISRSSGNTSLMPFLATPLVNETGSSFKSMRRFLVDLVKWTQTVAVIESVCSYSFLSIKFGLVVMYM